MLCLTVTNFPRNDISFSIDNGLQGKFVKSSYLLRTITAVIFGLTSPFGEELTLAFLFPAKEVGFEVSIVCVLSTAA